MTPSNSYTVTESLGCRLVKGSIPFSALASLAQGMPKAAVMDQHAARMLDVSFAIGLPHHLEALCADPCVRAAAYERARKIGAGLPENAIEWLAYGRQDPSSRAMFQRFTGVTICGRSDALMAPRDPGDLASCRLLLDQVPEFLPRLQELADISPAWRHLMAEWSELCASMDREMPRWRERRGGTMPSTYAQMCALED